MQDGAHCVEHNIRARFPCHLQSDMSLTEPDRSAAFAANATVVAPGDYQPLLDSSGNPVLDSDGNPIFTTPSGTPLVGTGGMSLVRPNGTVVPDSNGNQPELYRNGTVVTDGEGNVVYQGPNGQPLVDTNGTSIVGVNGELNSTVYGDPALREADGSVATVCLLWDCFAVCCANALLLPSCVLPPCALPPYVLCKRIAFATLCSYNNP